MCLASGRVVQKHAVVEIRHVQDQLRHKQKLVESLVLGKKLRFSIVTLSLVQVCIECYYEKHLTDFYK